MHTSVRVAALATAAALTLGGCSLADAVSMSPRLNQPSPSPSGQANVALAHPSATATGSESAAVPTASVSPSISAAGTSSPAVSTPSASDRRTPGALDAGSVTHKLAAGAYSLVIDYWTTQSAATWTSSTPATIQLSAHIEGQPAPATGRSTGQRPKIKVTRFAAMLNTGSSLTALTSDDGEFVITPPFSYGSALLLPGTGPAVSGAVVIVQFNLLIETTPTSGQFFRQTVLDTLHLSFVPEETTK